MPKGRIFAPPTERDGVWFQHKTRNNTLEPLERNKSTSTGAMLSAPFGGNQENHPPGWSRVSNYKNYKTVNDFSAHDNRNSFQDHGVYFGDGRSTRSLGKRLVDNHTRQHHTDKEYLKHNGRLVVNKDYNTNYTVSFKGERVPPADERRFPKIHREPSEGLAKLNTTTVSQFKEPDVPFNTPLHVLAVSQEPFLKHNAWKFSYHGLSKCYPAYNLPDAPASAFSPIRGDPHNIMQ